MITNILDYLDDAVNRWADRTAIADDKNALTFALWRDYAKRIGTTIASNTQRSLRKPVLVFVDRKIEGLVGFMGVVKNCRKTAPSSP